MIFESRAYSAQVALACAFGAIMLRNAKYQSKAPYGRFGGNSDRYGVQLDPRLGWFLMELPATVCFVWAFVRYGKDDESSTKKPSKRASGILALLWLLHYANRGWYFPLRIRTTHNSTNNFALVNSALGAFITGMHGYLNGRLFSQQGWWLTDDFLKTPSFVFGLLIYEFGYIATIHSERVLRNLRSLDGAGPRYLIPSGGLFRYVTSPHYFGEITAYTGLWILTGFSPTIFPTWAITVANLVPRSFSNHAWYLEKFGDEYAKLKRKALIPGVL